MSDDRPEFGYLLMKRGYFYRPMSRGYTGVVEEAGRFSLEYAQSHAASINGVTFRHESEFPHPYSEVMGNPDVALHERDQETKRLERLSIAGSGNLNVSDAEYSALMSEGFEEEMLPVFEMDAPHPLALSRAAELFGRHSGEEELRSLSSQLYSTWSIGGGDSNGTITRLQNEIESCIDALQIRDTPKMSP